MGLCATLLDVTEQQRLLAGQIARAALDRKGIDVRRAGERIGMSPGTLYAIFNGKETVQRATLRAFEGLVGLPWDLLTAVREGDTDAVEAMHFDDADLRRYVLNGLSGLSGDGGAIGGSGRRRA